MRVEDRDRRIAAASCNQRRARSQRRRPHHHQYAARPSAKRTATARCALGRQKARSAVAIYLAAPPATVATTTPIARQYTYKCGARAKWSA
eukprot:6189818-Pleurochrysis_carterae.AAC.1